MRLQRLASLSVLTALVLSLGCQQPLGSPMTPANGSSTIAPITSNSGIGPFGGRTRISPPSTGSYLVPNNYMGGTANGISSAPTITNPNTFAGDNFRSTNPVQPAGFNQPSGATMYGQNLQPTSSYQSSAPSAEVRPNLGGMPVHDLTQAPAPPGYPVQGYFQQNMQPQIFAPGQQQQYQAYPAATPNQNFRPIAPGGEFTNNNQNQFQNTPAASIARSGDFNSMNSMRTEVPIATSPMQPSFGGSGTAPGFRPQPPSTDPVGPNAPTEQLDWRRPGTIY